MKLYLGSINKDISYAVMSVVVSRCFFHCVIILSIGDNRRPVRKRFIPVKFRDGNNGEQNNEVRRDKKKKVSSSSAYHGRSTKAFQEKCKYLSF